jgi:hypothetical protein
VRAHRWAASLALWLFGACWAANPPQREFEPRHFTGLTAKAISGDDDATLDIDFDRIGGGLLRFAHCREVLPNQRAQGQPDLLAQVLPSQAALVDILRLNCLAVHRFSLSRPARRSHLPVRWSAAAVAMMPADLLPALGPADQPGAAPGRGGTLARRAGSRRITQAADGAVRVTGAEVVALFHRLARADFDGDGSEDWLLRIDWAARQGDARGSALVLVGRPVKGGPLQVVERVVP